MKSRAHTDGHPRVASKAAAAVATVLTLVLAVAAFGCSSEGSGDTATTASATATTTSATSVGPSTGAGSTSTVSSTTTTVPQLLSDWDRELAETAQIQNRLAVYLSEQGAAEDDPRVALVFGLRARTQAITGRQALDQGNVDLADMAMKDVYSTLNLGRNIAEGPVSTMLEDAYSTIATVGAPSDGPREAAISLDEFIAALRPLLDEARALVPAT